MDFQENMFKHLENIIHCSGKTNINKEINVIQIIHCPIVMQKCCNMTTLPLGQSIECPGSLDPAIYAGCIPHAGPIHSHDIEPFRLPDSSQHVPTWSNCIIIVYLYLYIYIHLSLSIYSCQNHSPDIEIPYIFMCHLLSPLSSFPQRPTSLAVELASSRPITPAARTPWVWLNILGKLHPNHGIIILIIHYPLENGHGAC